MPAYQSIIEFLRDGELVAASPTNRAPSAINRNVQYLYELIRAASMGEALFARNVTVEPDAAVGMPVYFNASTSRYERSLATAETAAAGGFAFTRRAMVWGVVYSKANATKADLLITGHASLNITNVLENETSITPGLYYLSGQTPGYLVSQKPGVSVPVLFADGLGKVILLSQIKDFLDDHVHYRFELVCRPAGYVSPPNEGSIHIISDPDANKPGWLPASEFENPPAGAAFGYNLNADSELRRAWPPIPLTGGYVEWNRGETPEIGGTGVPIGRDKLIYLNTAGIWWMSNCYGDVPWPTHLDTTVSESESVSVSDDTVNPECPRDTHMQMLLWFNKNTFATDKSVVTSLRSRHARLIVDCETPGGSGSTGALTLDLDLDFEVTTEDAAGYLALKDSDDGGFTRGPVVEGLKTSSAAVVLNGSATKMVDGETVHQGIVDVSLIPLATLQLPVQLVRLGTATEEYFENVMYLGFRSGVAGGYRAKVEVPSDVPDGDVTVQLRFRILGRVAGTLPDMTLAYRLVPRPSDGLDTPADLPTSDTALGLETATTLTDANTYVEAVSSAFTVSPGDQIVFSLTRAASDGYAGELGILQQDAILEVAT